jgi:histidinol-phosphate aminotransferase
MPRFKPEEGLHPAIRGRLPAYAGLEDLETIAAQYGVDPAEVLKLDGNENPYGPSPKAVAALRSDYPAHRYADAGQGRLRAALARYLDVPADAVVAGSGSDELIALVFRLFLAEGEKIALSTPTFGMYEFDAAMHGVEVLDVPLLDGAEGWRYDSEPLIEAAREAKAVFIASPNNPTGHMAPGALIDRLLDTGALVIVDEAYIEFSHSDSLVRRAAAEPGLVVMRTFSKWGGLAGLRIGYAVAHPEIASLMMRAKQPYNVNIAAEVAAIAALEDTAVLDERACILAGERERMIEALDELGWLHPYASETNFVLMRLDGIDGLAVRDGLRSRGIFTRFFNTPRLQDHIRISMGTPEQNDRVLEAFRAIGEELGHA